MRAHAFPIRLLLLAVVLGLFIIPGGCGGSGGRLAKDKVDSIKTGMTTGMTEKEVIELLGQPEGPSDEPFKELEMKLNAKQWVEGKRTVIVGFKNGKVVAKKLVGY